MVGLMSPDRIKAIRELYAEWWAGIRTLDPDDLEAQDAHVILTGALFEVLPDLLDEIERLQAEREEGGRPRIRTFVKPDSRGGRA